MQAAPAQVAAAQAAGESAARPAAVQSPASPVQAAQPRAGAASAAVQAPQAGAIPARQGAAATPPSAPGNAAPEPQEEYIPTARELPEPIQRILPTVAMSGYMYSKNPADRLVLIDKALRREGDEVAPGLVLERLQPKGAVFLFRGYRYRVPY
jgi:general secretion pathway protein B